MQLRCSVILPIIGLILFAAVSYRSMDVNHHEEDTPTKYYWWSSLRLDSDPLDRDRQVANPCRSQNENCANWDPANDKRVEPGRLDRLLVFSALPAFLAGTAIVAGLSKLGIDEVLAFMVSMPILLFAWYYGVGWLIDAWSQRRKQAKSVQLKVT